MADSLMQAWETLVETPIEAVGLGGKPQRFAAFTVATAALLNLYKPRGMFDSNGNARPWSVTSAEDEDGTPVPWPLASLLIGTASVLFI